MKWGLFRLGRRAALSLHRLPIEARLLAAWESQLDKRFACVIVQPYVLVAPVVDA